MGGGKASLNGMNSENSENDDTIPTICNAIHSQFNRTTTRPIKSFEDLSNIWFKME